MHLLRRLLSVFFLCLLFASCHGDSTTPVFPVLPVIAALNVGTTAADEITRGGFNRYTVSAVAGDVYKISISGQSGDADLIFYGTDGTYTSRAGCFIDNTSVPGTEPEDCLVVAAGSPLYFGVSGTYLQAATGSFTIAVERVAETAMNMSSPVLDVTTRTGAVLYAVPVTAGGTYTIALTELDNDADLYVFRDFDLTQPAACAPDNRLFAGPTPEDCTFTADTSTLYIIVDGLFSSKPDVFFTAYAAPAPLVAVPANQGTSGSPVSLPLGTISTGQVGSGGTSWYRVNGLTAGQVYTVALNGMSGNVDLKLYTDNSFSTREACSIDNTSFASTTPESCTITANSASLYFTVTANTGLASYLMLAEPGP